MRRTPRDPDPSDADPDTDRTPGEERLLDADAVHGVLEDDLTARLERWSAAARVEEAAGRRGRERWLRCQAEEEGTLAGVLADLGERGVPVALHVDAGRTHHGRVRTLGRDFVALARDRRPDVLVALAAVAAVVLRPGESIAVGARDLRPELSLTQVIVGLGATREHVALVGGGADPVRGTLRAVGQDVVTVRLDGDGHRGTAYVPLAAVVEVELDG